MNDKTYEKRFSERALFWVFCGFVIFLIHIFIYLRIKSVPGARIPSLLWLTASLVMTALPILTRRTERIRSGKQRRWTDRIGAVWTLFVVISFLIIVAFDALTLFTGFEFTPGFDVVISFCVSAVTVMLGVKQANTVQTTVIRVPTQKLPEGRDVLRVVQLTDLHLGPWTGIPLLKQVVEKINKSEPDIIVVTGDLADGRLEGREREIEILSELSPGIGVYAVTGNHDYYDDVDDSIRFMESAGMRVLRTEGVEAGGIIIAGADDRDHLVKREWNLTRSETLVLSFAREQRDKFLLLLRHRPILETGTEGHFDLQLSGHTHGGQLFPLISSRHKIAGHTKGLKKLKCGGLLYVCNGAGFVGPPVRLMAPPEIAVFDIVREDHAAGRTGVK